MKHYEVWGWDTFAYEDYFCGSYSTRKEAEEYIKKHEIEIAEYQDEGLRDRYT